MAENPLNTLEIRENVELIIKFKNSKFMKELKKKSNQEFVDNMDSIFKIFKYNFPSIYNIILVHDNLEYLYKMLDVKDKIDNGGDKEKLEKELGELLANEYIYPLTNKN